MCYFVHLYFFFFFNDTATTEIYTLSLHDALPILIVLLDQFTRNLFRGTARSFAGDPQALQLALDGIALGDRKSTRLNSSHSQISYAVFCLKKKKNSRPQPK